MRAHAQARQHALLHQGRHQVDRGAPVGVRVCGQVRQGGLEGDERPDVRVFCRLHRVKLELNLEDFQGGSNLRTGAPGWFGG